MIGALLLGFVAGIVARVLMPGDVFRKMSGPASWGLSLVLGLAGALLGYVIFTLGLGIGDTDIFDWGGLLGAIIGTVIVLGLASYFLRRRAARSEPAAAQPQAPAQAPAQPQTPTQAPAQPQTPTQAPAQPQTPTQAPAQPQTPTQTPEQPPASERPRGEGPQPPVV
jgi:uncharacterized membrane protein YeaQ/YmgE (transglycosylase-associated protein family)